MTALVWVIHGIAALAVVATGCGGRLAHLLLAVLLEVDLVHDDDWRGSRRCNATAVSRAVRDARSGSRNEQQVRANTGEGARSPMGDGGQLWWWCALGCVVV